MDHSQTLPPTEMIDVTRGMAIPTPDAVTRGSAEDPEGTAAVISASSAIVAQSRP